MRTINAILEMVQLALLTMAPFISLAIAVYEPSWTNILLALVLFVVWKNASQPS